MSGTDRLDLIPAAQIGAIFELWRRERREVVASFGGVSMLPTISPGVPLRISCDASGEAGDVILFRHRGEIAVHRLLAYRGGWMLTRGDANAIPDQPVRRTVLMGRISGVQRDGEWYEVPAWIETSEQRRARRLVQTLFALFPPLATPVVVLLWRVRSVQDAWRRLGALGTAARIWSKTGGRLVDVDLVSTLTMPSNTAYEPLAGFRSERAEAGSPLFAAAARVLGVDARKRGEQDVYVLIAPDGSVAACSFNDRAIEAGVAHQRGVAVDARFRGRGLASSILRYQARELAAAGAREVQYHVAATNRASRRLFASLGARPTERWIILTLLRRFRFSRRWVA